jgi:hypothetical protein
LKKRKMSSICIAGGCLDAHAPVNNSFVKLYQWPESDAEFLRKVSMEKKREKGLLSSLIDNDSEKYSYHESYVSRQRFLRSYTFSKKKETAAEKTKKWLKEKQNNSGSSGSCNSFLHYVFKFLFLCVAEVDVQETKGVH